MISLILSVLLDCMSVCRHTQLGKMDLTTGDVTPIGTSFNSAGLWTQGGFQAVISSTDRCNLFMTTMFNVIANPLHSIVVFAGFDMSSGKLEFAQPFPQQTSYAISYANINTI